MAKLKMFQIIAVGKVWHLTQRQARPPEKSELGCNTVCGVWAMMKDGYERGTPTCEACLRAVVEYESKQPVPWTEPLFPGLVDAWAHPGVVSRFLFKAPQRSRVGSRRRRRGG